MNTAMLLRPKAMITYLYGDTSAADGLVQMIESGFTAVPVINRDGYYLGVVSERDFLFCILDDGSVDALKKDNLRVSDLASVTRFEPVSIDADFDILSRRIISQNFVPVIDSRGMFSGIVTRQDIIKLGIDKINSYESKL
ncbi:MAG: CBS domain-containing protein [Oscillospiraceae bacterium]|nr:CBS domain-containing protein [Oscillospiraceae bacterium]MBQ4486394.1 CBS domain-containing protein [Oscillospiraceae bacterium]MCR5805457.1 CBS domain-containing protein [Oscillospiraceae bacterium]